MDVPGQAEVSNLHDVALCDQDVPGGQVSVYTLGWREWGMGGGDKTGEEETGWKKWGEGEEYDSYLTP